ncbi:uncharacterized protein HD556DRAFT_1443005 [Suillus plorans]|uniref:Uncharacterized protein n=1 Tax=Suillus plorans TaxID=116603 RepID=A0A9P7ASZ3_9AGAM|nr:uncharacterized protein HD556DRAFT_1443005 [Suillus plorans]KAG1794443.1 hypothetical protein HD556DRAFT_1443005 [Suillus plorans]
MPSSGPSDKSPPPQTVDIPPAEPDQPPGDANAYVETLKKCWATGSRLELLQSHIPKYASSLAESRTRANDYLDIIVNDYFTHFHWKLKVSEEPPADVSLISHCSETLTPLESLQKQRKIASMRKTLRNWFDNRSKAVHKIGPSTKAENNPWTRLLSQLSGVSPNKPRALQAHQRWSKDFYESIVKARFEAQWELSSCPPTEKTLFRDRVTRVIFEEQEPSVIKKYEVLAQTEGKEAVKKWKALLENPPLTDPVSRQAALDGLAPFAGPLLSGISSALGMHVTLMVGGPEPRKQGKISVISMHEGVDLCPQPRNWQTANKEKFKIVTKLFQEFLDGCYTEEDHCDRKLPDTPTKDPKDSDGLLAHPNSDTGMAEGTTLNTSTNDKGKAVKRPAKSKRSAVHDDNARLTYVDRRTGNPITTKKGPSDINFRPFVPSSNAQTNGTLIPAGDESSRSPPPSNSEPIPELASSQAIDTPPCPSDAHTNQIPISVGAERSRSALPSDSEPLPEVANSQPPPAFPSEPPTQVLELQPPPASPSEPPMQVLELLLSPRVDNAVCSLAQDSQNDDIVLPTNSPAWIREAIEYLTAPQLPSRYNALLTTFLELEKSSGFSSEKGTASLSSKDRPLAIHWWISRARTGQPPIPENFGTAFWSWWCGIQPAWRNISPSDEVPRHNGNDWSLLDKPGKNGFWSVLAALKWWGCANSTGCDDPLWHTAVDDVKWVMERITEFRCSTVSSQETFGTRTKKSTFVEASQIQQP